MTKQKAKFDNLENVHVRVLISGYNKRLDCIERLEAGFFTESEKKQIIKLTKKFLDRRAKELKTKRIL